MIFNNIVYDTLKYKLIQRNIEKVYDSNISVLTGSMFIGCSQLISVSFPNVTIVGSSAFASCSALTTISFPSCSYIGGYAFRPCRSLTAASFPNCIYIGTYAFAGCSSLATISFPSCEYVGHGAFQACYSLTTANFPNCTTVSNYGFVNCYSLSTISFPNCISIGYNAFQCCTSLTSVDFPKCTYISMYAFQSCISLTTASFSKCSYIGGSVFSDCYNLISLYLNSVSSVPTLDGATSRVFYSTPIGGYSDIAGRYGSVYVPSSLYNSFLTATNWSSIAARIVAYSIPDLYFYFTEFGYGEWLPAQPLPIAFSAGMTWSEFCQSSKYNIKYYLGSDTTEYYDFVYNPKNQTICGRYNDGAYQESRYVYYDSSMTQSVTYSDVIIANQHYYTDVS